MPSLWRILRKAPSQTPSYSEQKAHVSDDRQRQPVHAHPQLAPENRASQASYLNFPSIPSTPNIYAGAREQSSNAAVIQGVDIMNIDYMPVNVNIENGPRPDESTQLEKLREHCVFSALVNSKERCDPPRCKESTRLAILQEIEEWTDSDDFSATIFWLRGGAGAGKSAIAQTLAEKYQRNGKLAASFFFFRAAPSRSNGDALIPTIAFQLVQAFPDVRPHVEHKIRTNLILFSQSRQSQTLDLLLEPLHRLALDDRTIDDPFSSRIRPRLIVIDGLDECNDPNVQCDLLRIIAATAFHVPYPFRFLITSRSESHIVRTFDHHPDLRPVNLNVRRYNLSSDLDADHDIRLFLRSEFQEIRQVHPLGRHLPPGWPDGGAIDTLVRQSSSHFIYASTVVRYIQSPRHRPDDRLEVILGLLPPPDRDRPYAQLDALYGLIFLGVEEEGRLEDVHRILGLLYFYNEKLGLFRQNWYFMHSNCQGIDMVLSLRPGDLELFLDPLMSLVVIVDTEIRVLHKSLFDYLFSSIRSGPFHLNLSKSHGAAAAYLGTRIVKRGQCSNVEFEDFAYHCGFGCPDSSLFKIPDLCQSLYGHLQTRSSFGGAWVTPSVFRIMRALRLLQIQDLLGDWPAETHQSHITALIGHFKTIYDTRKSNSSSDDVQSYGTEVLFTESLASVLRNWHPQGFNAPNEQPERITTRCNLIQKEHELLWKVLFRTFVPNDGCLQLSSLDSKHFIHNYYRLIWDDRHLLVFFTYAKHTDACFSSLIKLHPDSHDVISRAREHLLRAEEALSVSVPFLAVLAADKSENSRHTFKAGL